MNAPHTKSDTETAVERLDLALERAELVHAMSRLSDRIYALKQRNSQSPDIQLLERTARSLQKRLDIIRRKSER